MSAPAHKPRRGRPREVELATANILIRVRPDDKRTLQQLAEAAGLSLSAYLIARGLWQRIR